jgi:hypothetical protein
VLGGDENAKVLQSIATVMKLESHNGHWLKDTKASETVRRAVNFVIGQFADSYQPPPFSPSVSVDPLMERAKVLPSDATPEAMAYKALERAKVPPSDATDLMYEAAQTAARKAESWLISRLTAERRAKSGLLNWMPIPNKDDETPGGDGGAT